MEIVMKKLEEIAPYENNPRNNKESIEYVANSIREFGFQQPIVVDKNGVIIAGHTRYEASKKLKLKEVPVIVADKLTDEQVRAYRLADNKAGESSEWIDELLGEELAGIDELNMEDFGFDLSIPEEETEIIEDEVVEPPEEPKSKLGQIYRLGRHRLMCGDSTDSAMVNDLIGDAEIDLLLTDPPYNVDYEGKTKEKLKIENDKFQEDEFYDFLTKAFTNAEEHLKDGASFYVWYASREVVNFSNALRASNLTVKQELIWNKNSMVMGRQDFQWKHEPCLYGWKETASHNWYNDRKQTTVIDWDRPTKSEIHPTMKPVGLFDYQMKCSSKKGDNVLDLFGGSGTTIIACEQNGRNAFVMEYDPRYVDAIIERWEKLTGEKAVLVKGETDEAI